MDEAERIARFLVESRLAACVAIAPGVRSLYRWKGALEQSEEWSLTIKSRCDLFAPASEAISRLHSYEKPEILALPVVEGDAKYLQWMEEALQPTSVD